MSDELTRLVQWFRHSTPYIHAHRDKTFVVSFGGEALSGETRAGLIHDLALLSGLGVRLVLVPGARPQIEQRLHERGAEIRYVNGLRVTDGEALRCVQDAVGCVRLELEALFSMGLANSPMAGLRLQLASGNFVTARPLGVRDGVDYQHTGEVRRVDAEAIVARLDEGAIAQVSPLGVSPTGEQFNLYAEDVAVAVARALQADKLIMLHEGEGVMDTHKALIAELTIEEATAWLAGVETERPPVADQLERAVEACRSGVPRAHLLPRGEDEAILGELFTRDGIGTLVAPRVFEQLRTARVDDIGGILSLIAPLERDGTLVERTRERLENQIEDFMVMDREGTVVGCAALHSIPDSSVAELACLVVHPDYRGGHRGATLLQRLEQTAQAAGHQTLCVLTTRTAHWFQEQGFEPGTVDDLPVSRQSFYNLARGSKVFIKPLA
ncbi:N-acetylglutamate synthase [Spiribacter salinus M19-40]|uniref:Amino-acid acetyltransferase n=1 Tax=Spiribacter salinus M19-40 TaxID=1260251 RepID=R4VMV1_9GAMM|nr:amino-acid N-acetyltransferase [Spiribacter salinus]AGM41732.1 N-acetylglutamate synthase [Spiribacter salinus M19-40]